MRSFQIHFSQSQNHFLLAFSSYAILFFLFEYFLGQPLEMYPLYWTPSKEGTFCVIRLNLS